MRMRFVDGGVHYRGKRALTSGVARGFVGAITRPPGRRGCVPSQSIPRPDLACLFACQHQISRMGECGLRVCDGGFGRRPIAGAGEIAASSRGRRRNVDCRQQSPKSIGPNRGERPGPIRVEWGIGSDDCYGVKRGDFDGLTLVFFALFLTDSDESSKSQGPSLIAFCRSCDPCPRPIRCPARPIGAALSSQDACEVLRGCPSHS